MGTEPVARRVLVVDDDADVRDAVRDFLLDEGYHVEEAADGEQGLASLTAAPVPTIVLLDLMMPGTSGWQFLDRLADHPFARPIVVVMSALRAEDLPVGLPCLRKPFSFDELRDIMRELGAAPVSRAAPASPS